MDFYCWQYSVFNIGVIDFTAIGYLVIKTWVTDTVKWGIAVH